MGSYKLKYWPSMAVALRPCSHAGMDGILFLSVHQRHWVVVGVCEIMHVE